VVECFSRLRRLFRLRSLADSCDGLVLLVEPQGEKRGARNLSDLEADTGQITDGVTGTTESGNEDLVVLINETHAAITGYVASNSLVVLFELHSHALTHGGVRLLGLDTDFLDNDAGRMGSTTEGLSPFSGLMRFLVTFVGPSTFKSQSSACPSEAHHLPVETPLDSELASSLNSTGLSTSHC